MLGLFQLLFISSVAIAQSVDRTEVEHTTSSLHRKSKEPIPEPIEQILFQDQTARAGLQWAGEKTFSVAWVDFNLDGYEDLYIQSHQNPHTRLLLNQRDGRFLDALHLVRPEGISSDTHGTAWADFDNDGDPDLMIATGAYSGRGEGGLPNLFLRNDDGVLVEVAKELGVDYHLARGRSPFWFDHNGDGLLDLIITNEPRPDGRAANVYFEQQPDHRFEDRTEQFGLATGTTRGFTQLASIFPGEEPSTLMFGGLETVDLTLHDGKGRAPTYAEAHPFRTSRHGFIQDAAIGDFNGDLQPDLFLPRSPAEMNVHEKMLIVSDDGLSAILNLIPRYGTDGVAEIRFRSEGPLTVDLSSKRPERWASEVFLGFHGRQPDTVPFEIDPADPLVKGIMVPEDTTQSAFYAGIDASGRFVFRMTGTGASAKAIVLRSTTPIQGGVWAEETNVVYAMEMLQSRSRWVSPTRDILLLSSPDGYIDATESAGLDLQTYCGATVTADFDNDGDLDIYMACGLRTANLENVLYLNDGEGKFTRVARGGGATSSITGPQFFEFGFGQRVSTADYDNDGFIDIYVGSTHLATESDASVSTPPRLYRNVGNDHHWLQINLEGTKSNRDGVGARVVVETPDGVRQLREHSGGAHRWGQDSQRLHFGLAEHTKGIRVTVTWPSGEEQVLKRVNADQILHVVEPNSQ